MEEVQPNPQIHHVQIVFRNCLGSFRDRQGRLIIILSVLEYCGSQEVPRQYLSFMGVVETFYRYIFLHHKVF